MKDRLSNGLVAYALARGIVRGLRRPKRVPLTVAMFDRELKGMIADMRRDINRQVSPLFSLIDDTGTLQVDPQGKEFWRAVPKRNWLQRSVRRFSSMLPTWMNPSTYSKCTVVLIQSLGCLIFPAAIVVGFSEWRSRSQGTNRRRSSNTTLSRFAQRVGSLT